jgi:hypothetical protein
MRGKRVILGAFGLLLLGGAADATVFTIAPGAEGKDSSPYAFLPSLPRGNHGTIYAFVAEDENGIDHSFESYLEFEMPVLAACGDVVEATLELSYELDDSPFGDTPPNVLGELRCHEVLEPWSEDQLTWNNKPDYAATPFDVVANVSAIGPLECDATELVQDWISGTKDNHGIALTNPSERLIGMYSFEAADPESVGKKAKLVIETTGNVTSDADGDCITDAEDNCPADSNNNQQDTEDDGVGDACDVCPTIFDPAQADTNGDGRGDACGPEVADVDDDGEVTKLDKKAFKTATKKGSPYREDLDLNGDGLSDKNDGRLWSPLYKQFFVKKPR